jgi:hypothetical protein
MTMIEVVPTKTNVEALMKFPRMVSLIDLIFGESLEEESAESTHWRETHVDFPTLI